MLIPPAAGPSPASFHYNTVRFHPASVRRGVVGAAFEPSRRARRTAAAEPAGGCMGKPLSVSAAGAAGFLADVQHLTAALGAAPDRAATAAAVLREVRHLECVQIDPVAVVERNQHLVLAARVPGYAPSTLRDLLRRGRLFEYWANAICAIPIEDYPIFEGTRRWYRRHLAPEIAALKPVVRRIVTTLRDDGPMHARAFASPERIRGYWGGDAKATSHALTLLFRAGDLVVAKREGAERYFALPEHAIPEELRARARALTTADANDALFEKYVRACRVFDGRDPRLGWGRVPAAARRKALERRIRAGEIVPLRLEAVTRPYFVRARDIDALRHQEAAVRDGAGREDAVRFLPPLDNLLWRRERLADLFDFQYRWEGYTPVAKRRYGHYAMPILSGARLIGRLDPWLDRERGRLVVRLLHLERGIAPTRTLRDRLAAALERFAAFHGVREYAVERTDPPRLWR